MEISILDPFGVVIGKVAFYQQYNEKYAKDKYIKTFIAENTIMVKHEDNIIFTKMNIINSWIDEDTKTTE